MQLNFFNWVIYFDFFFCLGCKISVIVFYVSLKNYFLNVFVNMIIKFEKVQLNKGNGYDFVIGVFIVLEDGVYLFVWFFIMSKGGIVYFVVVVDNWVQVNICINN